MESASDLEFLADCMDEGKDLIPYLKEGFDVEQAEILCNADDFNIPLKNFVDFYFDAEQMNEVLLGLVDGINVTSYCNSDLSVEEMCDIREELTTY